MSSSAVQTDQPMPSAPEQRELDQLDAYWRTANYLAAHVKAAMQDEILRHRAYAYEHGTDAEEIDGWRWGLGHSSCTV